MNRTFNIETSNSKSKTLIFSHDSIKIHSNRCENSVTTELYNVQRPNPASSCAVKFEKIWKIVVGEKNLFFKPGRRHTNELQSTESEHRRLVFPSFYVIV